MSSKDLKRKLAHEVLLDEVDPQGELKCIETTFSLELKG
jgi:hypothetical protein